MRRGAYAEGGLCGGGLMRRGAYAEGGLYAGIYMYGNETLV